MIPAPIEDLAALYESDETAWLDAMAELARDGRLDELDLPHLAGYLADMARRDRREVESRLAMLIAHVLERQELRADVGRGVLRRHAEEVLSDVYKSAVERASAETGVPREAFPAESPLDLDGLLVFETSDLAPSLTAKAGVKSGGGRPRIRSSSGSLWRPWPLR